MPVVVEGPHKGPQSESTVDPQMEIHMINTHLEAGGL